MMKRIILSLLVAIGSFSWAFAQFTPDTVFYEPFDTLPYSVTTFNTITTQSNVFNDTNAFSVTPPHSYHSRVKATDTVFFETNAFSTVGNTFVLLQFDHICKIWFQHQARIYVSNDNGTTWTRLRGTHYRGPSPTFNSLDAFQELSYPDVTATPYWGGATTNFATAPQPQHTWWASETFDISVIAGSGPNGTANGYPNVKVRFALQHRVNSPGGASLAGWFVDNVLVTAAPCELTPPSFNWTQATTNRPEGARYASTQLVRFWAEDIGDGLKDSAVIHYRMNGGPWMNAQMTKVNTNNCPSSSFYEYSFTGLVVGDSVDYHIELFDCACPNKSIAPSASNPLDFYSFRIEPSPPVKCGPTLAGPPPVIPYRVESVPWIESFESPLWTAGSGNGETGTSHRGSFPTGAPPNGRNWTVTPNANQTGYAWSVRTGATPLQNTGPNNARTGQQYIYTESQQTSLTNTTELTTPCISLSSFGCTALEFYYHMFGNHMGTLHIDIDTGTTGPSWINSVYSISGPQQTQASQAWRRAVVGLNAYGDKQYVRIRFRAIRGQGPNGHISIDDLRLYEPPTGVDMEVVSREKPINGFCSYGTQEDVEFTVRTLSCTPVTSIPIAFSYVNTSVTPPVTIVERDTIVGTFNLGEEVTHIFSPKANLSAFGLYEFKIWTEYPNDINNNNDTLPTFNIRHDEPYGNFPIFYDFDGPGFGPGNYATNPGTFPTSFTDLWSISPDNTQQTYSWRIATSFTPTPLTGPRSGFSNRGNYLYTEGDYGIAGANAVWFSRCIDLSGMTNPTLDLFYHMYGADIGGLMVQVVPIGSSNWSGVPGGVLFLSGNPSAGQTSETDNWKFWRVDLSPYANTAIRIRIIANKGSGGSAADIAIDNVAIYNRIPNDAGATNIQPPGIRVPKFGNPASPSVTVRNYGTTALTSIPITVTITPSCGTQPPIVLNQTFSGNIQPGQEQTFAFTGGVTYPDGEFEICATTNVTGDALSFNNEWCKKVTGWMEHAIDYSTNFNSCVADDQGFAATGRLLIFEKGAATGTQFAPADNPPNIWGSGLNRNYTGHASYTEFLNFPRFIGFDTIWGAEFRIKHRWNFGTSSGGQFQYQAGNTWLTLGVPDVGTNVYPTGVPWASQSVTALQGPGYVGSNSQWVQTVIPLSFYNDNSSPLLIRARLEPGGTSGQGWAFDNFELYVPPQYSASPIDVDAVGPLPIFLPGTDNTLRFRIQNTGAKRLANCLVHYRVYDNNGNLVFGPTSKDTAGFSPTLFRNSSAMMTHSVKWSNPTPGTYTLCAITSEPNGRNDQLPADDSICFTVLVFDEIDLEQNGFCDDFEDPNYATWGTWNYARKNGITNFRNDIPAQPPYLTPLAGSPTAWVTGPDFDYKSRDSSALYSPMFLVNKDSAYDMSFMHTFKTELYHDGIRLDVTYDAGYTWKPVGNFNLTKFRPDFNWYNTEYVTSLDFYNPGWTGDSEGWIKSRIRFQVDTTAGAIFRFRFAADQTIEMEGWAMDSFCIGKTHVDSADHMINVEELEFDEFIVTNLFPNPTHDMAYLPINMPNNSKVNVIVNNMLGQRIHIREENLNRGKNMLEFDVKNWASGMYTITLESDGHVVTKKLVVSH